VVFFIIYPSLVRTGISSLVVIIDACQDLESDLAIETIGSLFMQQYLKLSSLKKHRLG
jgi:hypothetical protein